MAPVGAQGFSWPDSGLCLIAKFGIQQLFKSLKKRKTEQAILSSNIESWHDYYWNLDRLLRCCPSVDGIIGMLCMYEDVV